MRTRLTRREERKGPDGQMLRLESSSGRYTGARCATHEAGWKTSAWTNGRGAAELSKDVHHLMIMYAWLPRPFRQLHELFWRGVGLNWANDGFKFVHISRVDVAWRLGDLMGTQSRKGRRRRSGGGGQRRTKNFTPRAHGTRDTTWPKGEKISCKYYTKNVYCITTALSIHMGMNHAVIEEGKSSL